MKPSHKSAKSILTQWYHSAAHASNFVQFNLATETLTKCEASFAFKWRD